MGLAEELAAEKAAMAELGGGDAPAPAAAAPAPAAAPVPTTGEGGISLFEGKKLQQLSAKEIQRWLESVGLDDLMLPFKENDVDGEALASITEDDLKSEDALCYVASFGQRKKLLREVAKMLPPKPDPVAVAAAAPAGGERRQSNYAKTQGISARDGDWSHQLMWCAKELVVESGDRPRTDKLCVTTMFCPCIVEGKIAAVVHSDFEEPIADVCPLKDGMLWENCIIHGLAGSVFRTGAMMVTGPLGYLITFDAFVASYMRMRVREKYDIPGSQAKDCLAHWLCFPCALTQEYEELKLRIERPPGWKPKQFKILSTED